MGEGGVLLDHAGQAVGPSSQRPVLPSPPPIGYQGGLETPDYGNNYILVASQGGAPKHPHWYHNLQADPHVEIRDKTEVFAMRVREVVDSVERERLWAIAVGAFPPYQDYQNKTDRIIPILIAEPVA